MRQDKNQLFAKRSIIAILVDIFILYKLMKEEYPTLREMSPWHKKYPLTRKDWWNIFRGPQLWSIAPNEYVVVRSNESQRGLHELMDEIFSVPGKKFFVIFFWGIECGDACPALKMFADTLEAEMWDKVSAVAITNFYDDQNYDSVNNILGDTDASCAKAYGATGESIFVINREKKIVWKSSGLLRERLHLYLKSA